MSKKETKTNAMRMLDEAGILYTVHTYDAQDGKLDAVSVAETLNQNPEQVFKTLVTIGNDRNHYVFVVPGNQKLDLKACAKAAGVKNVEMIPQKELLKTTGYIHGGCSPVGMKKLFPTWIDETAQLFDTICVSGGRIGLQVELNPSDLIELIGGKYAAITAE
ncbi:MAG: Cys-tRNA(Pro) deacylase [Bulleidia sp.]